jgi:hypothetical protein
MPPNSTEARVQRELRSIVGLELAVTRRAADLRGFHFGELRPRGEGKCSGEIVLHVQCAWRIEGPDGGLLTGRADLWEPTEGVDAVDLESWDYDRDGNLQDKRIAGWLGHHKDRMGSRPPAGNRPVVLAARATPFGGAEIDFSDGYRLALFPAGSVGEDWRLFRAGDVDAPHFVVAGGRVQDPG